MTQPVTALQSLNCSRWIQRQVSAAGEKLWGLCSTDCKVHALLVLGRVLQAAAIGLMATTAVYTFTAGSIALLGLIPAVAFGVLGTCLAENKEYIQEIVAMGQPFIEGQPSGLRNSGGNCWLNSGLQMLANIPSLARHLRRVPELTSFLGAYQSALSERHKVAPSIDTHLLRQFLSRQTGGQVDANHVQEDAAVLFEYLFQGRNFLHTFSHRLNGAHASPRHEPLMQVDLIRGQGTLSFQQVINYFFDHPTDTGQRQQLFFDRPPENLLIQFNRFYRDPEGGAEKINNPIDVSAQWELPRHFVLSRESAAYACDAFLCHNGVGLRSGHYVAYIKKGDIWWYCSDSSVFQVTKEQAENAMKQSYILHFSRGE